MIKLINRLKLLNLPMGKYAIFGSGPMGIRGLRNSHDLDLIVSQDLFDEYKEKDGWLKKATNSGHIYLDNNGIEFYNNWAPGEWNIQKLIDESDIIDDLPFVKLEYVLEWKKLLGRDKDKKDIELINQYLKNKNL